jgi:toxin-antitoxin system PIN domain toxin
MILPDVNVLIYAFREEAPYHLLCHSWLRQVIHGDARFGLSRLVLSAVVRVCSDHRIFHTPSSLKDVLGFCDDLLGQPHCQIVEPGEGHWEIFKRLSTETDTRGRRVTDAWYAALAIEWDCEWITFDRDYARFPGLKWRLPNSA